MGGDHTTLGRSVNRHACAPLMRVASPATTVRAVCRHAPSLVLFCPPDFAEAGRDGCAAGEGPIESARCAARRRRFPSRPGSEVGHLGGVVPRENPNPSNGRGSRPFCANTAAARRLRSPLHRRRVGEAGGRPRTSNIGRISERAEASHVVQRAGCFSARLDHDLQRPPRFQSDVCAHQFFSGLRDARSQDGQRL